MDPVDAYDAPSVRPGAAPTLSVSGSGLAAGQQIQPAWLRITAAIVRVLRWHFGAAGRIEHPDLADRVWTADQEQSPIQIASLAEWKPANAGQRPAVLVDRLDQEKDVARRLIGNQYQGVRPGYLWWLKTGSHVVHCLGGREGEVDVLAWEVERDLARFANVIREAVCLHRFDVVTIKKRTQLDDEHGTHHYTVPVVCTYGYEETARVFPLDEAEVTAVRTLLTQPS